MNNTTKLNILAYVSEPDKNYNYFGDTVEYGGKRYFVSLAEERVEFLGVVKEEDVNTKTYQIKLEGCDDTTGFEMELTDEEYELLKRVSDKANETSEYCCMPRMYVKEVKEENKND